MGEQKENFDDRCVSSYHLELFLSDLTNDHALCSVSSDMFNHLDQTMVPKLLGTLIQGETEVSNHLDFYEDF